eukprot:431930-Rhodomonas_salina.1
MIPPWSASPVVVEVGAASESCQVYRQSRCLFETGLVRSRTGEPGRNSSVGSYPVYPGTRCTVYSCTGYCIV